MPLAEPDFGPCDPLKPHVASARRRAPATPGPAAYDVADLVPNGVTSKYTRAGGASFGESRSRRFANGRGPKGPGFEYACGDYRATSSRLRRAPRAVFSKASREASPSGPRQTPGPSDYAPRRTGARSAPSHAFSGPLANLERFAETNRELRAKGDVPGPGSRLFAALSLGPTMGTSRRFMKTVRSCSSSRPIVPSRVRCPTTSATRSSTSRRVEAI